jgi:hypothetical protein
MTWDEPTAVSDVLKSEKEGHFCRGVGVIKSGAGICDIGLVLGKLLIGAATSAAKTGGNTGTGTMGAVTVNQGAKRGVYQVRFTAATVFQVMDPDGNVIGGNGATGTAFADDLGFTITAGGTAFVAGDGFDITVAAGSEKLVAYDPTAKDGSQVADSVLLHKVDATSEDVAGAVILANGPAEISPAGLKWGANVTTQAHKDAALAALAKKLILARQSA